MNGWGKRDFIQLRPNIIMLLLMIAATIQLTIIFDVNNETRSDFFS